MIQIKRNNKVFFTLEDFGEGSKLSYQLMDHHYIILKFTTATPVYFEIGDSVEIPDFGYFELTSSYFPKHNDSDGYDYEMQMDAYYMSWKNKLCKYRPQHGANETSFNLTTTVGVHMNVILGNLKALGLTYNGKDFSVDYTTYNNKAFDVQKRFLIEYGSISILDALNAICSEDALNCEWWIDGSIIYLGYCEMEGQATFEQDVNVLSMSYSESKSTYITRLYAFGSDRNIPKGYFTGADADVTIDGVATDYLMLPNKKVDSDGFYAKDGYLENVNVVKSDKQAIEGVVMFEDEYPKVECRVSRIKTYDSTVDNDDGTKTTQTFWQVGSMDSFAESFEASWIKSNLTLGIKFTSGALMGMEFDVSFKIIDKENFFEIVANDTYGRTLPDSVMCPKEGDRFFLFNWDATKITDTDLIPTAQLSLFDRAKQYYQKTMISNSNFTCTMDGDKFYNDGTYDYHPLGEQVKLINDMFAQVDADGKHYRNSRIIGMEIPLDIPYDHPQYTVGEKAATSRLGKLEDKVDSIKVNGMQIGGTGSGNGGGVYVIGMNDTTPASDSNVYSSRRSRMEFLSRLYDGTAKGTVTFEKVQKFMQGLIAENSSQFKKGATFGDFIQGMLLGTGGRIDEFGNAEFESIVSRSSIIAKELITNRQTAMESNFVFTESGLVDKVTENKPATEGDNITYDLKLQKRWDNDFTAFRENDVILASVNTLDADGKYYDMWMRVLSVNTVTNTITVVSYPDNEVPSKKNYPPCELARLIRWGNAVDEDRQSCWYISSSDGLLVWLDHVTKPIIDKTNYSVAIGKLPDALSFIFADYPLADKRDGAFYAKYLAVQNILRTDYQGNVKQDVVDRGKWSLEVAKGDKPYRCTATEVHDVWHYGCRWRCLADKTTDEPKYASTGWAFVEGNPEFKVEMTSDQGWDFDSDEISRLNSDGLYDVFTSLSFKATLYNREINDFIEAKRVTWTRDTGNPKEDNAWAIEHASSGFSVSITWKDLGTNADERWNCRFKVEVELINETVQSDGQSFQSMVSSDEMTIL
nr:MAG TPA: tail protein [Bacteriophage sp.]